eukprot:1155568-Pelagomonas_calceolata.AAC.1
MQRLLWAVPGLLAAACYAHMSPGNPLHLLPHPRFSSLNGWHAFRDEGCAYELEGLTVTVEMAPLKKDTFSHKALCWRGLRSMMLERKGMLMAWHKNLIKAEGFESKLTRCGLCGCSALWARNLRLKRINFKYNFECVRDAEHKYPALMSIHVPVQGDLLSAEEDVRAQADAVRALKVQDGLGNKVRMDADPKVVSAVLKLQELKSKAASIHALLLAYTGGDGLEDRGQTPYTILQEL